MIYCNDCEFKTINGITWGCQLHKIVPYACVNDDKKVLIEVLRRLFKFEKEMKANNPSPILNEKNYKKLKKEADK